MDLVGQDHIFGMQCPHAEKAMRFLRDIGLQVEICAGATGFTQHVEVIEGGLMVDPKAEASCLLHEAGHLAIVPEQFRHFMSGNLMAGMQHVYETVDRMGIDPDSALHRAVTQISDPEATAWGYAAGKAIGLPDDVIIRTVDYDGDGDFIRLALAANAYVGIHGVSHAGFCAIRKNPYRPLPVYPQLAYWLQK